MALQLYKKLYQLVQTLHAVLTIYYLLKAIMAFELQLKNRLQAKHSFTILYCRKEINKYVSFFIANIEVQ